MCCFNRPRKVAVSRDDERRVKKVLKTICHKLGGNIHVGHFFFVGCPCGATTQTRDFFFKVMSVEYLNIGERFNRLYILLLSVGFVWIFSC